MKKIKAQKKITAWIMTFLLTAAIFIIPANFVNGQTNSITPVYTALGDSISYGYSADPGKGYVDLLYNYLKVQKRYDGLKLNNLSVLGATSGDLLNSIKTDQKFQDSIKSSTIITISIGGNNLLQPLISAVAIKFGVNPANNPNFKAELSQAIINTPASDRADKINAVIAEIQDPSSDLYKSLVSGVQSLNTDIPNIITEIKKLNSTAEIYFSTLYTPANPTDSYYSSFDFVIQTINSAIKGSAVSKGTTNYQIVDVYTAFKNHTGNPVVNFNFAQGSPDPHPTTEGHKVIFDTFSTSVKSISLGESAVTLDVGKTHKINAVVLPQNSITNPDVTWTSADNNVASVDENGLVTAKAKGNATIIAEAKDGSKTASITVTVSDAAAAISNNTSNTPASNSSSAPSAVLPQTGSLLDSNIFIILGTLLIIAGTLSIAVNPKRK
ncbi:MAG: GDSL-type esterase/lipase family protein [Bacillota bacterium]|nr:GDSL-type esterase/lipase family protein [Bacillota bacterium]